MKYSPFVLLLCAGAAYGQLLPSLNWGSSGMGGPNKPPGGFGRPPPNRPPYGPQGGGFPPPRGEMSGGPPNFDDPIPPLQGDHSYDTQQLPSKLPILAPNGVVEIYNRVVDDLIKKLEMDFQKRALDPMEVVIRPTPPGPVRVPGYLQKRPYRRPGAALYRSSVPATSSLLPSVSSSSSSKKQQKRARSGVLPPETRFGASRPAVDDADKPSFRGSGKISKGPLEIVDDEKEILETTAATVVSTSSSSPKPVSEEKSVTNVSNSTENSSEEDDLFGGLKISRSDEYFPEEEDEPEARSKAKKEKMKKKEVSDEDEDDEDKAEGQKDVDTLLQRYQSKNAKSKDKYSGGKKAAASTKKDDNKPVVQEPEDEEEASVAIAEKKTPAAKTKSNISTSSKKKVVAENASEEGDDDDDEDDEPDFREDIHDDEYGPEPGTGGGQRPQGGYYPQGGPPAIPAKPNAELTGLSRIKRSADVSVSVDARSAIVTARLLVGPLNVVINDSSEPMEKNVKATIPELEAELLLMERHGVVFLQRFTLDRAYGQDVEISIPKSKSKDKKKGAMKAPGGPGGPPPPSDPNHPINIESRRQTKMAAHISMEVVKLLRSGNLRVNLMRTAQAAMSKLKLPIQKAKAKKSKGKKEKSKVKKDAETSEQED